MPTSPAASYPVFGLHINGDCDTVIVESCEIGDCNAAGILLDGGVESGPRLIRLNDVFVERAAVGFAISSGRDIRISGCHAAQCGGPGFVVSGGDSVSIANCQSVLNNLHGFYVSSSGVTMLTNCVASYNSQLTDMTYSGCYIEQNGANIQVVGNRYGDCVYGYSGAKRQAYGLVIGTGASNIIAVANNTLGNGIGGIQGVGGATVLLAHNL